MRYVLSLGGSVLFASEGKVNVAFLTGFRDLLLRQHQEHSFIVVVGGGKPARLYQGYGRTLGLSDPDLDWVGIAVTRANAELLRGFLGDLAYGSIIHDPTAAAVKTGKILIAGGHKPGQSTDAVAATLAGAYHADALINISDTDHLYTADPKKDPKARAIEALSYADCRRIIGTVWAPGSHLPFDPTALAIAEREAIPIYLLPRDLKNLDSLLSSGRFTGTTVSRDVGTAYLP